MADYIIPNGQYSWNQDIKIEGNDTIFVQSGGVLSSIVIPRWVGSVTLEDGAYLNGTIGTAKELSILGTVYGYGAILTLDISERTPEEAIMINDWSQMATVEALSFCVGSGQGAGTYRLIGNASGFSRTVSITNTQGAELGTLSLENPELDCDLRHYTLLLNEANELCLTVSSSLPSGTKILLTRNGQIIDASLPFADGLTLPSGEYDHLFVVSDGFAEDIFVEYGGVITVTDEGTADAIHIDGGVLEGKHR